VLIYLKPTRKETSYCFARNGVVVINNWSQYRGADKSQADQERDCLVFW